MTATKKGKSPTPEIATQLTPAGRTIAGVIVAGVVGLVILGIVVQFRISQQEAAELLREVTPLLQHVDFSPHLRNDERFAGPVCLVHPSGRRFATVAEHPFFVRNASTLAVCRVSKPSAGTYKYVRSGAESSLTTHRIVLEVCLIDLKNPARKRVIIATSQPPSQIQSEQQYHEQATHTLDDQTDPGPAPHDEQVLLEKVLLRAGLNPP